MPVEIMELVIKATVREKEARQVVPTTPRPTSTSSDQDKSMLVQEVVEQVLEILKQQKER
ncbi:MAG: DUF5908 family protein [Bacteroidota bacterium]